MTSLVGVLLMSLPHMGMHTFVEDSESCNNVSHQALLLQAQDDEVEDKKAESQHTAIQNPELADGVSQERRNNQILSEDPCSSSKTAAMQRMSVWAHTKK